MSTTKDIVVVGNPTNIVSPQVFRVRSIKLFFPRSYSRHKGVKRLLKRHSIKTNEKHQNQIPILRKLIWGFRAMMQVGYTLKHLINGLVPIRQSTSHGMIMRKEAIYITIAKATYGVCHRSTN